MYLKDAEFKKFISESFSFLKNSNSLDEQICKSIPIEKGTEGYLIPVGSLQQKNKEFAELFHNLISNGTELIHHSEFRKNPMQVLLLNAEQIAFLIVDQFNNNKGLVVIENDHKETNSLSISSAFLFRPIDKSLFIKAIKRLTQYVNENYVIKSFSLYSDLSVEGKDLFTSADFIKSESSYVYKFPFQSPPQSEILTAGPTISAREATYVLDATRYGWNSEWSKYIKKFESTFADYIGVKHALGTSSCTGALHIALTALGIGPGDEVIVPEITWVATASAIRYVGATPVFCDIDESNWCIDATKIEKLITPKTKCIMPVHVYGHPADMDKVMEIANKHKLYVVEDAAPAIGAECRGRKAGSYGHFACFSFQGAKLLVTGEGGMLVTNDPELYKRAYAIWDHGRTPGTFWINEVGLKYKMANALAALGLGQLERAEEQIRAKRRVYSWYADEFKNFPHVKLWTESDWAKSIYWMSSLTIQESAKINRDEFFKKLKAAKVDTRPVFPAISQYPMWKPAQSPTAKKVGDTGVNLPSGVCLKEEEVRYVAQTIKKIILEARGE